VAEPDAAIGHAEATMNETVVRAPSHEQGLLAS
jgi:hypothetical protein